MNQQSTNDATPITPASDRELTFTRRFNAPPPVVYKAWTTPDLFKRWWAPRSMGMSLYAVDMDVRAGGKYRVQFSDDGKPGMEFFGIYQDVVPNARIVWTNDETQPGSITTVTFEEEAGTTLLTLRERYPTKEARDAAGEGMESGMAEQFSQLDELLSSL